MMTQRQAATIPRVILVVEADTIKAIFYASAPVIIATKLKNTNQWFEYLKLGSSMLDMNGLYRDFGIFFTMDYPWTYKRRINHI